MILLVKRKKSKNIVKGFKGEISMGEAMTGREFCNLLSIDYDALVKKRKDDQEANLKFFMEELKKITRLAPFLRKQNYVN